MFNRKSKTVQAILIQAYLDNMEFYGRQFIKAKRTIDHLEGDEFNKAWGEMKAEYQRKCTDDAIKTLVGTDTKLSERANMYFQTREIPHVTDDPGVIHRMPPLYAYCVLYYIYTGKTPSPIDAGKVDSEIQHMMKTWTRTWGTNYRLNQPLYMGKHKPEMEY